MMYGRMYVYIVRLLLRLQLCMLEFLFFLFCAIAAAVLSVCWHRGRLHQLFSGCAEGYINLAIPHKYIYIYISICMARQVGT